MPLQVTTVMLGVEDLARSGANQWGYFGYFSDLDGYLWKVATAT